MSSFYENEWVSGAESLDMNQADIHIWKVCIDKYLSESSQYLNIISQDELERSARFCAHKDQASYVTSRGILRKILSRYLLIAPNKIKFNYNNYGKPYLCPTNKINDITFNVSHSGSLVLYVVARNRDVGIDVEEMCHVDNYEKISEMLFSHEENTKLKHYAPHERLEAFYKCWTSKEAIAKAIGQGLSYPLHTLSVSLDPSKTSDTIKIDDNLLNSKKWHLFTINPEPNYKASFSFNGSFKKINYWRYV